MSMSKEAREAKNAYNREWYHNHLDRAREQAKARSKKFYERKAAAARSDKDDGAATNAE